MGSDTLDVTPQVSVTYLTVGGDIQSYFPGNIKEDCLTKTAEISLGDARIPLSVSGSNVTIIIRKAR